MPSWWGERASTCVPSWMICTFQAVTPRSRRGWRPSWATAGPRCPASTPGWPSSIGSGRPFSTFGPGLEAYPASSVAMVGLAVPCEEVDRRIAARFARWVEDGLLDEVRTLAARPAGISRTARQALGYRELLAHVEEGAPLNACVEEAVRRTRSFARRQASWFRRDPRIVWTDPEVGPADLLDRALAAHASRS